MIIGYKRVFPWGAPTYFNEKILNEAGGVYGYRKIHTLREDKHERWKAGNTIHHAYGTRTKQYNNFLTNECTAVQKIGFLYRGKSVIVEIDGHEYARLPINWNGSCKYEDIHRMTELAHNDGFDSIDDFLRWFDHDMTLRMIHWTDKLYG